MGQCLHRRRRIAAPAPNADAIASIFPTAGFGIAIAVVVAVSIPGREEARQREVNERHDVIDAQSRRHALGRRAEAGADGDIVDPPADVLREKRRRDDRAVPTRERAQETAPHPRHRHRRDGTGDRSRRRDRERRQERSAPAQRTAPDAGAEEEEGGREGEGRALEGGARRGSPRGEQRR